MGAGRYGIDELRAAIRPEVSKVETAPRARILRSADEVTTWGVFESLYTLENVLEADTHFGPWESVKSSDGWDKWLRAGSDA